MLKIIYMGTPDFAVPSLETLHKHHEVLAVVTAPDKPAGRGRKLRSSAVKQKAVELDIPVFQPEKLKDENFVEQMKALQPDLMVVVAFRMLPAIIWKIPKIGTFNLHASLLPQYRGAAPINHTIMNGEKVTGNTSFFIDDKIDTGKILLQNQVAIDENETAGELHNKLMMNGAELVLETVNRLEKGEIEPQVQTEDKDLKAAPKIFKQNCQIHWDVSGQDIHNRIRGLSPHPTAWTNIEYEGKTGIMKLYESRFRMESHQNEIGSIVDFNHEKISVAVKDGVIDILKLQPENKKPMLVKDFKNGYHIEHLKFI